MGRGSYLVTAAACNGSLLGPNPKEYECILAKQPKAPTMRGISKALRNLLARSAAIVSAAYSLSVVPATSYGLEVEILSDHRRHGTTAVKKRQMDFKTRICRQLFER